MKMILLVKDLETDWPTGGQLPDFFQTKADKKLIWKLFNLYKWRLSENFLEREKIAKLKFETWFCVESELIVCGIITQKINEQLQWIFVQYLQQFIYLLYLLKNWPNLASFCLFSSFSQRNDKNSNFFAINGGLGIQTLDHGCRWIHWAMVATLSWLLDDKHR